MAHANLEIRILDLTPEGYPVEITFDGEQRFPRGYLQPDMVPWIPSASTTTDGERLFNRLLADDRLKTAWAAARGQSPRRRIRLWIDATAPGLHTIPWELLRDAGPGLMPQTLAADIDTPFSRYLADPQRPDSSIVDRPIKLLVAIANPANLTDYSLPPLDIETERQLITQAVSGLGKDQLDLTFLEPPVTLSALEDALKDGVHLLHLVGHGRFHPQREEAVLFLANDDNQVERVSAAELAELVARQAESPRLVFLAACQTATRSPAEAFRGFAPRLIAARVPAVVAMQDIVPIDAAREFTRTFYRQILRHGQVDLATNEGRSALLSGRDNSWAVPVLYSKVPDGIIMEPAPRLWKPIVTKVLTIGGVFFTVLGALAMLLGLSLDISAARQPDGPLAWVWPAPTSTATPTATATPTGTPTATATPTPIPAFSGDGFNIAVAQFTTLDDGTRQPIPAKASEELSGWLFDTVDDEIKNLPPSLRDEVLGPDKVLPILGQDASIREANAALRTKQISATLLIYGVITRGPDDNVYYVQPEFYITEDEVGFSYGSEIKGADRLGQPITFTLPLDRVTFDNTNRKLYPRSQALREIIGGLANFYINRYDEAYKQFERAAYILEGERNNECKKEDTGREVVYLLMGAAQLRTYRDSKKDDDQGIQSLNQAYEDFVCASQINPDYARSYLGLGSIALQQATELNPEWPDRLDISRLSEAEELYLKSLNVSDQPDSAYVPVKATFGLGQIRRLAYEYHLSTTSGDEARRLFESVIAAFEINKSPDLIWFVGHAYAELGRLAGLDKDYELMSDKYRQAVALLINIRPTDNIPYNWIADYWAEVAFAQIKSERLGAACEAYRQAIDSAILFIASGKNGISREKLGRWQTELDRLEKGTAC